MVTINTTSVLVITVTPPEGPAKVLTPLGAPGTPGRDGADGAIVITGETEILTGNGVPDDSLGTDTQIYLDNVSDDVYKKVAGHWELQTNIKGQKGDKGDAGDDGADG